MNRIIGLRRILGLAAVAGLCVVSVGVSTGQSADPFVAGGRSTRPVELAASQAEAAKAHARELSVALGLSPGVSRRVERLDDRFEHRTYDEVTSLDSTGHEVAIVRLETDGTVAMAVALGWQPGRGPRIDASAAERRGRSLARAAGLSVDGQPSVRAAGAGGWSIAWSRVVDGTPVRGDGVRVTLWPDGTFHGLARTERRVAAAPAQPIASGAAREAAEAWAAGRYGTAAVDLRVAAIERAWVAQNGAFAPNGLDAPAETLRLAWVVRFDASGRLAQRLRSIELWLDAGDGSVLGGDVAE